MFIYHIVLPEKWAEFDGKDAYEPESLAEEGFIHCSYESQLDGVIARYFEGATKVIVLKIDPERLSEELIIEESKLPEFFPHIYGPINRSAIVEVQSRDVK